MFTIIDDTDDCFLDDIRKVYDVLLNNGLKTTKTVWVYPPRDNDQSYGDSLKNEAYRRFILSLKEKGYEIALHNVGSGDYYRNEIISGLHTYRRILGEYPKIHVNHSYNKDNIYSGSKRFSFPLNYVLKYLYSEYNGFSGEEENSLHFWGDYHKKYIKYSRNYEINDINTIKVNPYMPYLDAKCSKYSNYWFSSTFAPNQWIFNKIITKRSIDRLEKEGGICILYTHLGYYTINGVVDFGFQKMIEYIGSKKNGWFEPVSTVLDYLMTTGNGNKIPIMHKKLLEFHSLKTRIIYRYLNKIDDYHFKRSNIYEKRG
ncbi:hypothetical protein OO006_02945 [Prosthecochloris sp. SCSIO W1101]|uniref:hypothetical protein n=1 Tax=Prosthecochloris sp. SCSIO W1101 TaxID=2992242 RepID=UPI00223DC569|nr:hypothetical protein [Prosthecochloris sp. SCSIO W1101]UZJ41970.1 hypothetical protein OO006_02945 [Prosthecochloris sp. SCSIO W1101]